jgi:hypothetical protein
MAKRLRELFQIPTSGARGVTPFHVDGRSFLAIPQLAADAPGTPAGMNGGDSDTDLLILRRDGDGYVEHQRLAAPGGEDAEVFTIGTHTFLAVASIRSGRGPYQYAIESVIHRWDGGKFVPYQAVPTFAAKQWRHFAIGHRHFLALAQGVSLPQHQDDNRPSMIFEWDGAEFQPFQEIASQWAYNWHFFELAGQFFLAHADNVDPSLLYRWDGERFVVYQKLVERTGRAFATFEADGDTYLACAVLGADSLLLRWDGTNFVPHQMLAGAGGREFAVIERGAKRYVVRVNFILGTRESPIPTLDSTLYEWDGYGLVGIENFPTSGGTDVAVYPDGDSLLVAVSNSLSADVRFSTTTRVYSFEG